MKTNDSALSARYALSPPLFTRLEFGGRILDTLSVLTRSNSDTHQSKQP
jgi:hypothetical protein